MGRPNFLIIIVAQFRRWIEAKHGTTVRRRRRDFTCFPASRLFSAWQFDQVEPRFEIHLRSANGNRERLESCDPVLVEPSQVKIGDQGIWGWVTLRKLQLASWPACHAVQEGEDIFVSVILANHTQNAIFGNWLHSHDTGSRKALINWQAEEKKHTDASQCRNLCKFYPGFRNADSEPCKQRMEETMRTRSKLSSLSVRILVRWERF